MFGVLGRQYNILIRCLTDLKNFSFSCKPCKQWHGRARYSKIVARCHDLCRESPPGRPPEAPRKGDLNEEPTSKAITQSSPSGSQGAITDFTKLH